MNKSVLIVLLFFLLLTCKKQTEYKSVNLLKGTDVIFADSLFAASIVSESDDYTKVLSAYDRQAGMNSDKPVSQNEYIQHLAKNVKNWDEKSISRFENFSKKISSRLAELKIKLPAQIVMIHTTSKEIGGAAAAYTRQNAIMLSNQILVSSDSIVQDVFIHEIFHVYSRFNPEKQDKLYAIVGFRRTNEIELPEPWRDRLISNPDAPLMNTVIDVQKGDTTLTLTPFIFARRQYNPKDRGGIFQSLSFELLQVEQKDGKTVPVFKGKNPVTYSVNGLEDYWRQIGHNTNYIIHPEEIMASNFVFLINQKRGLKNPEIIEKMKQIIVN